MAFETFLRFLVAMLAFVVIQAQRCPTGCDCTNAPNGDGIIDCSGRGFDNIPPNGITVPRGTYKLAKVDFSNNMITSLDIDRMFRYMVYLEVDEFDFSSNRINVITGSFDASRGTDYETFNLSSNAFTSFPQAIVPKTHYRVNLIIDLSYNKLTTLTSEMFASGSDDYFPGFQFLVRNNMISSIHPRTFQGLELVNTVIDLRDNRLETLPADFENPRGVEEIMLSGNPWNCNCSLRWIIDKNTRMINYTSKDPPSCQSPAPLSGRPIFQLSGNEFACLPYINGPIDIDILSSVTTEIQCPVTADPPNPKIRWDITLPSTNGPAQFLFNSDTFSATGLINDPTVNIQCTATNNAGSLQIDLEPHFPNEK